MSGASIGSLHGDSFVAPLEVAYPYSRTVGTALSRFFTSMKEGRLEGTKGSDGRVYFPPAEFDPATGEQLTEWVTLPETGRVVTWAWQSVPAPDQPLDRPFAWALIALDGADVPLLHAVDAGSIDAMSTGMTVTVRWADERGNGITDIACFEPVSDSSGGAS